MKGRINERKKARLLRKHSGYDNSVKPKYEHIHVKTIKVKAQDKKTLEFVDFDLKRTMVVNTTKVAYNNLKKLYKTN